MLILIEYKNGNVPFKELARLQALQFNLENEKIDVLKNVTEKQSNLILLNRRYTFKANKTSC